MENEKHRYIALLEIRINIEGCSISERDFKAKQKVKRLEQEIGNCQTLNLKEAPLGSADHRNIKLT